MLKNDLLPTEAYTDKKWFELEMRHIFSTHWAFAGLVEDLNESGQFTCVQAGLNNIIVVMGRDQKLRAFHNLCRHKGTQLLRTAGRVGNVIACPYHDWTYNLKGDLIAAPKMADEFPHLDKSCLGLKKASVGVWRGMIWVHPEEKAPSLQHWFADIGPNLGPHKPELLVESAEDQVVETIEANWKIVVENYIDHYHLAQLHSGTLNMYDHNKAQFGFVGPHFAFWEPLQAGYAEALDASSALPLIDHIPAHQLGAFVPMLFPGIGLSETENSWSVFHVIPQAVDRTRVEIRTKVMPMSSWTFAKQTLRSTGFWEKRLGPKDPNAPAQDPLASADFMQEDKYVCEQQQKSFQSPYFELGPSAQYGESPVREHQKLVLSYLDKHLPA